MAISLSLSLACWLALPLLFLSLSTFVGLFARALDAAAGHTAHAHIGFRLLSRFNFIAPKRTGRVASNLTEPNYKLDHQRG